MKGLVCLQDPDICAGESSASVRDNQATNERGLYVSRTQTSVLVRVQLLLGTIKQPMKGLVCLQDPDI